MISREKIFEMALAAFKRGEMSEARVKAEAVEYGRANISPECAAGDHKHCSMPKTCEHRTHYGRRLERYRPLRGQSEEARKARLERGLCPTHGVVLVPSSEQFVYECSRKDCGFKVEAKRNSKLHKVLYGEEE